jgi:hypothetical protein
MIWRFILYSLLAALLVLMWLVLPSIYEGAATVPNETTGQVMPLNNHGTTVFVTSRDQFIRSVLTPVLFVLTFVLGVIHVVTRRRAAVQPKVDS